MKQKQIIVTAYDDGTLEVSGSGFVGKECDKAMAEIESALGEVTTSKKLPEYYQSVRQTQKIGGGK